MKQQQYNNSSGTIWSRHLASALSVSVGMAAIGLLLSLPLGVSAQSIDAEDRQEAVDDRTRDSASERMQGASGRLDEERGSETLGEGPGEREEMQASQMDPEERKRQQERLQRKYQEMIEKLENLIEKNPYSDEKPNWMFQKAELLWELRHKQYLAERAEYNQCLEAVDKGTTDEGRCEEPEPNYADAQKIYRKIETQYPNYERLDEVLYRLGSGLLESGEGAKGVSKLNQLVENYPNSQYKPEAHLALAEYFFRDENQLLGAAQENYKKVLNYPENSNYQYAQYKLAWVYFNRQSYRKSIETFKAVAEAEDTKLGFQDRAYRDMLKPIAEVEDGWEEARDYFIEHKDKEFAYDKLASLASYFEGQGKNQQAIEIYNYFIDERPNNSRIPQWMESIVVAKKKEAPLEEIESTMNRFIAYLSPDGTWWAKNKDAEGAHNNAMLLIEASLAYLANTYNQRAQEQKEGEKDYERSQKELYGKAAEYYRRFIDQFPEKPVTFDMTYFLADIELLDLEQYERAAEHYQQVVELYEKEIYPKDAEEKEIRSMVEDAAFGRVNAYDKLVQKNHENSILVEMAEYEERGTTRAQETQEKGPPSEKDRNPKEELLKYEKGFVKASDQYSEMFPDTEVTPTVDFVAAEVYKARGHYAECIPRYENIIENAPKHRYASFAGNSLLEANYVLDRWDEVEKWARYLLDNEIFDVTPREQLQSAIAYAINERAKDLQENDKTDKAADELLRLAEEFPESELAPGAIFNAAAIYESGEQVQKAVNNYQRVVDKYPEHEKAPESLFVLGAIFEARADFEQAAKYFSQLGSTKTYKVPAEGEDDAESASDDEDGDENMKTLEYKDHKRAPDAVFNAAGLYEAMEEWDQAISTYEKYIDLFPEQDDVRSVKLKIGYLYQNKGDQEAAMEEFNKFLDRDDLKPGEKVQLHSEIGLMIEDRKPDDWKDRSDKHFTASFHTWAAIGGEKPSGEQPEGEQSDDQQEDGEESEGNDKIPEPHEEGLELAWDAEELSKRASEQEWGEEQLKEAKLASRDAAAHARFRQAERVYKEFQNVEFEWPMSTLQERLKDKAEWLSAAETMYFQINSMKSPRWASAAVYRIGDMYQRFANGLDALPIPDHIKDKLNDRQIQQYNMQLDQRIIPLEEKALSGFQRALNVALELEAYNEWSRRSAEAIAGLDEQSYPVTQLDEVKPDRGRVKFYHPDPLAGEAAIERLKARYERNPPKPEKPEEKEGEGAGESAEGTESSSEATNGDGAPSGEADSRDQQPEPSGEQKAPEQKEGDGN